MWFPPSIVAAVPAAGSPGSNVTSSVPPTATHRVVETHATAFTGCVLPIIVGEGVPGAVGSNVTSSLILIDRDAHGHRRARDAVQRLPAVDLDGGCASRRGRVKRDLAAVLVDGHALMGRGARHVAQELARVDG